MTRNQVLIVGIKYSCCQSGLSIGRHWAVWGIRRTHDSLVFDFLYAVDQQVLNELIDASFMVKRNAYCPYSQFPVGAALLCPDGTIITGQYKTRS